LIPLRAAATVAACLLLSTAFAEEARVCKHGEASASMRLLAMRIDREKPYAAWAKPGCLVYLPLCTRTAVQISIHEKHNDSCGEDPHTFPSVDAFRVDKQAGTIEWMDFASGDYVPFERLCGFRKCAMSTAPPDAR